MYTAANEILAQVNHKSMKKITLTRIELYVIFIDNQRGGFEKKKKKTTNSQWLNTAPYRGPKMVCGGVGTVMCHVKFFKSL